jgi:hypothetical protein
VATVPNDEGNGKAQRVPQAASQDTFPHQYAPLSRVKRTFVRTIQTNDAIAQDRPLQLSFQTHSQVVFIHAHRSILLTLFAAVFGERFNGHSQGALVDYRKLILHLNCESGFQDTRDQFG